MLAADRLRYGDPVTVDGPMMANILESLQMALVEPCSVCSEHNFVCGKCSLRSCVVGAILEYAESKV